MKITHLFKFPTFVTAALVFLASGLTPVSAVFDPVNDDTDIFLANPQQDANRPNVLIILDNTANWSRNVAGQSIFINEKQALVNVIENLGDEFNVGLAMFPETGGDNDSIDGAYLRFGVRQMTNTNRTVLADMVNSFTENGDKGNNNTVALAMLEAFRYYSGSNNRASFGKEKSDIDGNTINPAFQNGLGNYPLPAGATGSTPYNSPISTACEDSFIIYISNGASNENASALSISESELSSLGYNTSSTIALSPSGQEGNWMDEWADFMANTDMNGNADGTPHVYSYVVEVDPQTSGQNDDMTALLKSVANKGKGEYFAVSSANAGQGIVNALNQIFQEIQAVNSVFAATTLPVSVNVRGTNLNQVYIGVFRPDEAKEPRWFGNLKAYQLAFDDSTSTLFLADKNGDSAENPTTGFINSNAESFWTTNSTFWGYRDSDRNGVGGASDLPDGDLVEKGGSAQQQRDEYANDQSTRSLYTCTSGGSDPCVSGDALSDTPFSTANDGISDVTLGLGSTVINSLSALESLAVTGLSDIREVTSLTTTVGSTIQISDLDNDAVEQTLTDLSTAPNLAITAITNNPVIQSISGLTRGTGQDKNIAIVTVNGHGFSNGQVVHVSGVSTNEYNGTFTITVEDANTFTYDTGNPNPSNNPGITNAEVATTTNIVEATVPSHGYTAGNQVTITGVDPTSFNGTFTISSIADDDTFRYTTASALPPVESVAGAEASSSAGTIATATTGAAHGFLGTETVTITGASPTGFNGTYAIIDTPSTTTFTIDVGNALGTASTPGVVSQSSGTVTATTSTAHNLTDGDTITITGAVPNGYNGTFTVDETGTNTFTYNKANLGPWDESSNPQFISGVNSTTVTATIEDHGFGVAGDTVTIDVAGAVDNFSDPGFSDNYNGDLISATVVDQNTLTYTTQGTAPDNEPDPATAHPDGPDGTNGTDDDGTILAWLSTPTVIATVPAHGFTGSDPVTISGSTIPEYNRENVTITVIDTNTIQYAPSAIPAGDFFGDGLGASTIAGVETSTARAEVANHGLTAGDTVTIVGVVDPTTFNGSFSVDSVIDQDTFTYSIFPEKEGIATLDGNSLSSTGGPAGVADDLVNWVRGEDNEEDEDTDGDFTDVRPSLHGDVLHSRPSVVNYNRHGDNFPDGPDGIGGTADDNTTDDDVYIFYGANDGVFRAVKGGFEQSDLSEPAPGHEAWGFVPEEFFNDLERLRNNSPLISSSNKKPYFADGSIGTFVNDVNNDGKLIAADGDEVFIFISMHRGGRLIYALDVSDPLDPVFMWKKSPSDWPELGQTWSTPFVTTIKAQTDPVLIFGAGYDPLVEDVPPDTITAFNVDNDGDGNLEIEAGAGVFERSMGRGIFVVDARTGDLIFQAGPAGADNGAAEDFLTVSTMVCAIPGDGAVISDRGGSVDNRAYFGDTCANIWRLDMDDADPANWTITKLADLNDESNIPGGLRKFLFPPDVVFGDNFDAVLIGSGDREHPFDEVVTNRFYMIRDLGTGTTPVVLSPLTEPDLFDATSNCIQSSSSCAGTGDETDSATAAAALDAGDGWFITLGTGEKVVGNAVTLNNVTFFNTNQPSDEGDPSSCESNLGVARQYQVNFDDATVFLDKNLDGSLTAADRSVVHPGGGYLPSPVPVVVQIDGEIHEGVISGVKVQQPPGSLLGARLRKFWFKEFE